MKRKLIITAFILNIVLVGCADSSNLLKSANPENMSEHGINASTDNMIVGEPITVVLDRSAEDLKKYSLVDEGYDTPIKSQRNGTCWVYAPSTSMESTYKKKYGEDISIDYIDLLEAVYSENPTEGYFLKVQEAKGDIGGWVWQVVEKTANGFDKYILEDASSYVNTDIKTMKSAIVQYGAMNVAINDANQSKFGYFDNYYTLNDPDSEDFDHAVVLVGWDDDFPKEYFRQEAKQNGAWLAQNSRGDKWGNGGYYWVSYDTPFIENTIFQVTDVYKKVVSYDGGGENHICTGDITKIANIFHEKGLLKAIGTYTVLPSQKITIDVCDDKLSKVLFRKEVTFEIPGYHTVELDTPIEVEDYAVAISYDGDAPVEGESWENSLIGYAVTINPGESFVCVDGKWIDMANKRIRSKLGIDFTPNNCCIKAIY